MRWDVSLFTTHQHESNSPVRRLARVVTSGLMVMLLLEIILRLGAFIWFDSSQYYLYYGFHELAGGAAISPWSTNTGQYYKFPPHHVLQGAAGQASEKASINSLGFRGPEFQPSKPAGVFRIISMGESSTFGFRNSDRGTYPFQLEELFQHHPSNLKVEVINAGFPYYNTGSILSLLREELVHYSPDALTLYVAYNDAGWPLEVGRLSRTIFWFQQHSIVYALLKNYILTDHNVMRVHRWLQRLFPQAVDHTAFEHQVMRISTRFRENVKEIINVAKFKKIPLTLIKQPMTTAQPRYTSFSYEEEYEAILDRYHEKKRLTPIQYQIIKHHHLIKELEKIAEEENMPLIDNIAIVDQDRRRLASWVHLTEEANLRLAEALKVAIEPYIEGKFAVSRQHEP